MSHVSVFRRHSNISALNVSLAIALTDEQAALTIPHLIERTEVAVDLLQYLYLALQTLAKALNTGEFEQAGLEAEVSRDDTMRIPFEDVQEIESVPIVHVYEKSDGYVGTGLSSDDDAISDDEVHLELEEMMEDAEDHDGGRFLQIRRHESPAIDSAFGETCELKSR